ncbi:hypothetical protein VP01_1400g2 [Puccinia sorghi]|uniref:Uncharacterized protein n=1 Tax=Puccinia sorghi TaxID=27349 RepID=A0A0L6VLI7_9BASI|nr:hypothetical protein VP01_1400g2 [Puccinia sorghi]
MTSLLCFALNHSHSQFVKLSHVFHLLLIYNGLVFFSHFPMDLSSLTKSYLVCWIGHMTCTNPLNTDIWICRSSVAQPHDCVKLLQLNILTSVYIRRLSSIFFPFSPEYIKNLPHLILEQDLLYSLTPLYTLHHLPLFHIITQSIYVSPTFTYQDLAVLSFPQYFVVLVLNILKESVATHRLTGSSIIKKQISSLMSPKMLLVNSKHLSKRILRKRGILQTIIITSYIKPFFLFIFGCGRAGGGLVSFWKQVGQAGSGALCETALPLKPDCSLRRLFSPRSVQRLLLKTLSLSSKALTWTAFVASKLVRKKCTHQLDLTLFIGFFSFLFNFTHPQLILKIHKKQNLLLVVVVLHCIIHLSCPLIRSDYLLRVCYYVFDSLSIKLVCFSSGQPSSLLTFLLSLNPLSPIIQAPYNFYSFHSSIINFTSSPSIYSIINYDAFIFHCRYEIPLCPFKFLFYIYSVHLPVAIKLLILRTFKPDPHSSSSFTHNIPH